MNFINLNSWTAGSSELKTKIISFGNPDIICVCETHLEGNESMCVEGFKFYGHARTSKHEKRSGGVAILIKNEVFENYSVKTEVMDVDGMLSVVLTHKHTEYVSVIIVNYLPPCGSSFGKDPDGFFNKLLIKTYEHYEADVLFMCGDFNARIGDLQDVSEGNENYTIPVRASVDKVVNSHGRCLLDFLNDSMCCVLNGRLNLPSYTCHVQSGSSTVDYGIAPYDVLDKISSFEIYDVEELAHNLKCDQLIGEGSRLPDHDLLQLVFVSTGHVLADFVKGLGTKSVEHQRRSKPARKFHAEFMNNNRIRAVLLAQVDAMIHCENIKEHMSEMYEELCSLIREEMEIYKKCGRRKSSQYKPFWNPHLSQCWKEMRRTYNNAKKYLNSRDKRKHKLRNCNIPEICEYRKAMNYFDRELRLAKRKFQVDKIVDIENFADKGDPRKFWDAVNKLGPGRKKTVTCEALDDNGQVTREQRVVERLWHSEFSKLYGEYPEGDFDDEHYSRIVGEELDTTGSDGVLNSVITEREVRNAINSVKNNKAAGLDGIPNEALRSTVCIGVLSKLFNLCFTNGIMPDVWSKCIILPIGKGNTSSSTNPLSHRGLALQSCIYKLYSLVLNKRISSHFENADILHETQNGFRPGRSCMEHIYTLTEVVKMNLSSANSRVYACFVDLRKAFPSVDRSLLLWKLNEYGISGRILGALKAVYECPRYCVQVNGNYTELFESVLGVPEGDPNSPVCFAGFINELLFELERSGLGIHYGSGSNEKVAALAYADDIVLLSSSPEGLQELVNIMRRFCRRWRLTVNVGKTKTMVFRRSNRSKPTPIEIYYNSEKIEQVSSYKYLGVMVDETLSFKRHSEVISAAGSRALGGIISKTKELKDLGYLSFNQLMRSCVFSVLDYGAEIMGWIYSKEIENVQLRAARFYLGLNRCAPIPCLNAEMGWLDSTSRRKFTVLNFYQRLLNLDGSRLPKKVFLNSRNNPNSWNMKVRQMLEDYNLAHYWDIQSGVPKEIFEFAVREKAKEKLSGDIDAMPKLRTYQTVRIGLEVGTQVKCLASKFARAITTQLKCGVLPLRIETGRYNREALEDRICLRCSSGQIESEYHFLFDCAKYDSERRNFLTDIGLDATGARLCLKELLKHPFAFSKYIVKIWQKRQNNI